MLFTKSLCKVSDIKLSRLIWAGYVAAQGGHKEVKEYTEKLRPTQELGAADLLRDIKKKGRA